MDQTVDCSGRLKRWRVCLAGFLSPGIVAPALILEHMVDGPEATELQPGIVWLWLVLAYLVSAIAGAAVAYGIKRGSISRTALPIVGAFAVASGVFAAVPNAALARLEEAEAMALLFAAQSLPISLTFCLIAGVPWRSR